MENRSNGEISVCELPAMRVASCFTTSRSPEAEVIQFVQKWASQRGLDFNKLRKFGFDIPVSKEQKKYGLRSYEYWISVPDYIEQRPDGVKLKLVSPAKFAKLRIKNPFVEPQAKIRAGWNMLTDWVSVHKTNNGSGDSEDGEDDDEKYMLEEIIESKEGTFIDLYFPMK